MNGFARDLFEEQVAMTKLRRDSLAVERQREEYYREQHEHEALRDRMNEDEERGEIEQD